MTASVTKNTAKDGSKIVRTYYSSSNFRSKGSAVCSANSIRKDDAERYVTDRIREVLAKPHILRGIVASINSRKKNRIKPLQEELEAIDERLASIEEKRKKYFELYEMDDFDRELFSGRMSELDAERDQLLSRKSEIEYELNGDNSQTVSYEQVRSLIERSEYLLQRSSTDQRKSLLHLIIQKITLNDKRQIDKIEMALDESTEQHFLSVAPSANNMAEGAFLLDKNAPKLLHQLIVIL
jgi:site-specific DNA recombinase